MYNDNCSNVNVNEKSNLNSAASLCTAPRQVETLTEIVESITKGTEKALLMTYQINGHLFGLGEPCREEGMKPQCLRDVMVKQNKDIAELCCELEKIAKMLGLRKDDEYEVCIDKCKSASYK